MTEIPASGPGPCDGVSRVDHWIAAAAMIGMLASGLAMEGLPLARETVGETRDRHKAVGVPVLLHGAWRVDWRLRQGFPPPAPPLPEWRERASKLAHRALLAPVLPMPVSGIVTSLRGGRPIDVSGLVIPSPGKVEGLARLGGIVHGLPGKALPVLVALPVGAALEHHFIDRDATLRRMTGGRRA